MERVINVYIYRSIKHTQMVAGVNTGNDEIQMQILQKMLCSLRKSFNDMFTLVSLQVFEKKDFA